MIVKKKKPRVFTKKLRGDKAFARDNAGLITNLTGYHGKAKDVPAEAIALAKGTVTALPALLAAADKACKRTPWATLRTFVKSFDSIHNTQIWNTFQIWIDRNQEFKTLNPRKRLAKAASIIEKIIEYKASQGGVVPSAQRFDEVNGTNLMDSVVKITTYQELITLVRTAAADQKVVEINKAKLANKHYEYGMR